MSKTAIPPKTQNSIWFKAHGRCSICNKVLSLDEETAKDVNLGEFAHIVADSPNGPRGDLERSALLAKEESNIILLCKDHHKLIDSPGHWHEYPEKLLLEIKREHEKRIEMVTGIKPNNKSVIVTYTPNIGNRRLSLSMDELYQTLFPDMYPATTEPVNLGASELPFNDSEQCYWDFEPARMEKNFQENVARKLQQHEHISLFAIAPQPLLVLLGSKFGDLYNVEVYQRHRDFNTWRWQPKRENNRFVLIEPEDKAQDPALIIALSAPEITDRVKAQMGENFSYWVLTCENPHPNMMRSKEQMIDFRNTLRFFLGKINENSIGKKLHIFPAMPHSCAVEMGRLRFHKADASWIMYDLQTPDVGYIKTITI